MEKLDGSFLCRLKLGFVVILLYFDHSLLCSMCLFVLQERLLMAERLWFSSQSMVQMRSECKSTIWMIMWLVGIAAWVMQSMLF